MRQMRRGQTIIHLILLWLLLAAFQHPSIKTASKVQATISVDVKLRPAKASSKPGTDHLFTTWVEGKKTNKRPSGPNPVGNHRPPSRR